MLVFFGHFVYFTAKWYILCPFGAFCGHLVDFFPFWYVVPRKSGNPGFERLDLLILVVTSLNTYT
jgi:hypothetical protein